MFWPFARFTVLLALWFVHEIRLPMETVAVNGPTLAPPVPVNVNEPPVAGRNELGGVAEYTPLGPDCIGITSGVNVRDPAGPLTVIVPASSPVIVGIVPPIVTPPLVVTMQLPSENGLEGVLVVDTFW